MTKNNIVKRIKDYIELHLDDDLSLDKIANEFNYSKYHIARVFAEQTNCTIYKYIQGRRLSFAAKQLVETQKPIIEIAYEAHYNSQQAFTLAFHQLYFCSPQTYRKNEVLYPIQTKISTKSTTSQLLYDTQMWGGKMAA